MIIPVGVVDQELLEVSNEATVINYYLQCTFPSYGILPFLVTPQYTLFDVKICVWFRRVLRWIALLTSDQQKSNTPSSP